jgi:transglutaminase-like putative cysteine protease
LWAASERSLRSGNGLWVLLLRNLLLYFLFFNAYLYFRGELDLLLLSAGFVLSVLLAFWMQRLRLRLWLAGLLYGLLLFGLRLLFFLVFRLQSRLAPGPQADFLYFLFDKDFFPGLLPWGIVWLLNFLGLRFPRFLYVELGLLPLLLVAVFWPQGRYHLTLYPHPSFLAYALFLFLVAEILLLLLHGERERAPPAQPWRQRLRSLASFLWIALPMLLLLLFFLLGRYSQGAVRQGGGLVKPTLFRFDFSQFIRLESEIEMSDDLVLLLRKEGPAERILLRRFILSGYEPRRGFFRVQDHGSLAEESFSTVPDAVEQFPDPGYAARAEVRQDYFLVSFDPSSLLAMNYPSRVVPLTNWDSSSFLRIYRVLSLVSQARPEELAAVGTGGLSPEQLRHYTDYGQDARIRELADSITGQVGGTLEKVQRIEAYLKSNYLYSLKPGLAADGDQLAHFLYESKKGYCSYFAFAMTLLCRSLGIPARVAVGFWVDPEMEVLNFYEVRANQAHAWVEVYFGRYGWMEFDPSSETIAPGEEDSVSFSFDLQTFARLLEEILRNQQQLREQQDAPLELGDRARLWGKELVRGLGLAARLWYAVLPALYLLILGLGKGAPRLRFLLARAPRDRVRFQFGASLGRLADLGLAREGEESLLEYAHRLRGRRSLSLPGWTEAYLQAVFAGEYSRADYLLAQKRRRAFLASLRVSYSPLARLLGFLNPLRGFGRRPR